MSLPAGGSEHVPKQGHSGADSLLEGLATATVDDLLELVRAYAGMDVAFVGEFSDDRRIIRFVRGEDRVATTLVHRSHDLSDTYCALIAAERIPAVIPDVREVAELRALAITSELDIGSYVGVPIHLANGDLYGTLCGFGHEPATELPADLIRLLDVVAASLARRIESPENRFTDVLSTQDRIRAVLAEPTTLTIVYQPIVALDTGQTVGYEALSRFPGLAPEPPDIWFADAHEVGLGVELELLAAERALEALDVLPADIYVSINLCAAAIGDADLADLLRPVDRRRVVIELTETQPDHEVHLDDGGRQLRHGGVRLAVDDLGTGFAGLARLLDLRPEIVKFDRFLTIGLSTDPRRSALAAATLQFCKETGAILVAEGVETTEDHDALRALGVPFAQGYLLGRPGPLPDPAT